MKQIALRLMQQSGFSRALSASRWRHDRLLILGYHGVPRRRASLESRAVHVAATISIAARTHRGPGIQGAEPGIGARSALFGPSARPRAVPDLRRWHRGLLSHGPSDPPGVRLSRDLVSDHLLLFREQAGVPSGVGLHPVEGTRTGGFLPQGPQPPRATDGPKDRRGARRLTRESGHSRRAKLSLPARSTRCWPRSLRRSATTSARCSPAAFII